MKTLVLITVFASLAMANDRPAKYEAATGTSVVSGIVSDRASSTISLRGASAAILYKRLILVEEEIPGVLAEGHYFVKRARELSCVKRAMPAKTEFECGVEVDRNGEFIAHR